MIADLLVGDWHLVGHPNRVAIQFPIVLARTYGSAARPTLVTIQQGVLTIYDYADGGHVCVGSPSREPMYDRPHRPAAGIATLVTGLSEILCVHYFDHYCSFYGVAYILRGVTETHGGSLAQRSAFVVEEGKIEAFHSAVGIRVLNGFERIVALACVIREADVWTFLFQSLENLFRRNIRLVR
jgi:hypothetical protein